MPLRVIASRPEKQNKQWAQRLQDEGYQSLEIPLIDLRKADSDQHELAYRQVLKLDTARFAIFVSQNAVDYGMALIDTCWPQFPEDVICLAVGARTQQHLKATLIAYYGIDNCVVMAGDVMNSEALLQLPVLQQVEDEKIFIFRGIGGRPKLADTLSERGAYVEHIELYERCDATQSIPILESVDLTGNDILPIFSGESLDSFLSLLTLANKKQSIALLKDIKLIVPGERVANIARARGFTCTYIAENASENAMIAAIAAAVSEN